MAKVLLVEDDNNLREIYEARLQAEGYEIVSARDGEEALVVAKAEKPDLVISDVMMPKISGFEMLDILRNTEELKNVKVIMLTALGQSDDQQRADRLGADRYLVKSQVTLEDIVNVAQQLLNPQAAATPVAPDAAPAPEVVATATPDPAPAVTAEAVTLAVAPEPSQDSAVPALDDAAQPAVDVPVVDPDEAGQALLESSDTNDATTEPSVSPAPATDTPVSTGTTDDTSTAAPVLDEANAVEAQIEEFVATTPDSAPESAPVSPESAPSSDAAGTPDDQLMADAIDKLTANTAETAAPSSAPEPSTAPVVDTPDVSTGDKVAVGGARVITPMESEQPDLSALLAAEDAKDANPPSPEAPASTEPVAPSPEATPPAPQQPGTDSVDPNSIAL